MIRIFLVSLIIGFFLGYSVRARAEAPLALSAWTSLGGSSLSDEATPDLESRGTFGEMLVLGTYELARWNISAGLGFFSSSLSGSRSSTPSTLSGLSLNSYTKETAGEVARLASHYRLTDHLEAGASAELLFGSDVGFSTGFLNSGVKGAWLGGIEILYGFGLGAFEIKAGARAFTSLNLPGRKLEAVAAVLQGSFPLGK